MKIRFIILFSSIILLLWLYTNWQEQLTKSWLLYIPNEIIVKYKNTSEIKINKNINEKKLNNLEIKDKLDNNSNIILLEINDDKSIEETVSLLKKDPNIEYAEPNYIRYFFWMNDVNTNDTLKNYQKSLELISWPETFINYSWFFNSNSWILIWIIDNWINYNHPDLINSMRNQWDCIVDWKLNSCEHWYDFFHNTSTPLSNSNDHWTHIAWIIAAEINNWRWIIWVNPYAKIVSLKAWNSENLTSYDEIRAINFAIDNWIKIINASYWSEFPSDIEEQAIKEFWDNWWLFITAAWNWDYNNIWLNIDSSEPIYPCSYDLDNIICVAATDNYWKLTTYSNYWTSSVDIAAPWFNIYSTIISWTSIQHIFSEFFEDCTTWWEYLNSRNTWSCYQRYNSDTFWYSFKNEITSPSINLKEKNESELSISITCNTLTDIWIEFSNNNSTYSEVDRLWQFYSRNFNIQIPKEYTSENFSFKLKILDSTPKQFCVIDDIEIFQDPYIQWNDDIYWLKSWTSMATPHVVWLASLIMIVNPTLSYQEIKDIILKYWDYNPSLSDKIKSWKIINIKKSLDIATIRNIDSPTWLESNRSWDIRRNSTEWVNKYYYEIYDINENFINSWITNNTWISTQLQWNFIRKVKWIDMLWNESEFSSYYICEKPNYWNINLSTWECSTISWIKIPHDKCSDSYKIIFTWNENNSNIVNQNISNNKPWTITKTFYIENSFWEKTDNFSINFSRTDSIPTMNTSEYTYPNTITSTNLQNIWNIINNFWIEDWECWSNSITLTNISCTKGNTILSGENLIITAPTSENWKSDCTIIFSDDEWNLLSWVFSYSFNTLQTNNWWWGGGWWWGGINSKENTLTTSQNATSWKIISTTWNLNSWINEEITTLEKPKDLKLFEDSKNNNSDKSRYLEWDQNEKLSNWYTREFNNAYIFAYLNGITTMDDINKADMNGELTRIAMAKMLSNYAINILWKEPINTAIPKFSDISNELNNSYWWAVYSAYQLWIMWIWINKFRPYDKVTRAEFATALSRILYSTPDGKPYYSTHLQKLEKEWIITNTNPNLKELRWYIMIMLMRTIIN